MDEKIESFQVATGQVDTPKPEPKKKVKVAVEVPVEEVEVEASVKEINEYDTKLKAIFNRPNKLKK